jgi:transcription antitermination factor NusG
VSFAFRELEMDQQQSNEQPWYALAVKHQHENAVTKGLRETGFDALLPLYKSLRKWSDRTKQIEVPVFPGYVFANFPLDDRVRVLRIPAVRSIVSFNGKPATLTPAELAGLRAAVDSKLPLRPWPFLKPGDLVRIDRGPLKGLEGTLVQEKDCLRFVISVEMLQRSVAVEVSPDMIVPLRTRAALV